MPYLEESITSLREQASRCLQNNPTLNKGNVFRGISLEGNENYQGIALSHQLIFDFRLLEQTRASGNDNNLFIVMGDTLHIYNIAFEEGIAIDAIAEHLDKLKELAIQKFNLWWNNHKGFILNAIKKCYGKKINLQKLNAILKNEQPSAAQQIAELNALLTAGQINISFYTWDGWIEYFKNTIGSDKLNEINTDHKKLYDNDAEYHEAFTATANEFVTRKQKSRLHQTAVYHSSDSPPTLAATEPDNGQAFLASLAYVLAEAHVILVYGQLLGCRATLYAGPISAALAITVKKMGVTSTWIDTSNIKPAQHTDNFDNEQSIFKNFIMRISQPFSLNEPKNVQIFLKLLSLLLRISIKDLHKTIDFEESMLDLSQKLTTIATPEYSLSRSFTLRRATSETSETPGKPLSTATQQNKIGEFTLGTNFCSPRLLGSLALRNTLSTPPDTAQPTPSNQEDLVTIRYNKQYNLLLNFINRSIITHSQNPTLGDERSKFSEKFKHYYKYIASPSMAMISVAITLCEAFSDILIVKSAEMKASLDELSIAILRPYSLENKDKKQQTIQKLTSDTFKKYITGNKNEKMRFLLNLVNEIIFTLFVDKDNITYRLQNSGIIITNSKKQRSVQQQIDSALKQFILTSDDGSRHKICHALDNKLNKKGSQQQEAEVGQPFYKLFSEFLIKDLDQKRKYIQSLTQHYFTQICNIANNKSHPVKIQEYAEILTKELNAPWYEIEEIIEETGNLFDDKTKAEHPELFAQLLSKILFSGFETALKNKPSYSKLKEYINQLAASLSVPNKISYTSTATSDILNVPHKHAIDIFLLGCIEKFYTDKKSSTEALLKFRKLKELKAHLYTLLADHMAHNKQTTTMQIAELVIAIQAALHMVYLQAPHHKASFTEKLVDELKAILNNEPLSVTANNFTTSPPTARAFNAGLFRFGIFEIASQPADDSVKENKKLESHFNPVPQAN